MVIGKIVRIREERKLDKQIDYCRFGAKRDKVTVLIERMAGDRTIPVLEITPMGDIREIPAPTLRTPIHRLFQEQYSRIDNYGAIDAKHRFALMVGEAHAIVEAERRDSKERRARRDAKKAERAKRYRPTQAVTR